MGQATSSGEGFPHSCDTVTLGNIEVFEGNQARTSLHATWEATSVLMAGKWLPLSSGMEQNWETRRTREILVHLNTFTYKGSQNPSLSCQEKIPSSKGRDDFFPPYFPFHPQILQLHLLTIVKPTLWCSQSFSRLSLNQEPSNGLEHRGRRGVRHQRQPAPCTWLCLHIYTHSPPGLSREVRYRRGAQQHKPR